MAGYAETCEISLTNTYDTCGTFTRSGIKALTKTQLEALFHTGDSWNEIGPWFKTAFEMRACGIQRNGLYEWLMSSNKPGMSKLIETRKRQGSDSLIQPFIFGKQNSIINIDHWQVTAGYATGAYTPGTTGPLPDLTGVDRVIRVTAGYGLTLSPDWFLPKHSIFILNQVGGDAKTGEWQVVLSALDTTTPAAYVDIGVKNLNGASPTADLAPVQGVGFVGSNNVHDVEAWCYNPQNVNPLKHVPFWFQTTRRARCLDDEYIKTFKFLEQDNKWFSMFQDLPLAERNRQDEMQYQHQFLNQFFWGTALENQDLDNWENLEKITSVSGASVTPGTGGRLMHYRANFIGVKEQLRTCNRVRDMQNGALNLNAFLEQDLYDIQRARKTQGKPAHTIDVWTDTETAMELQVKFFEYSKAKTGDIARINVDDDGKIDPKMQAWGFQYRVFRLYRPVGLSMAICTHDYFDDIRNSFANLAAPTEARGKFLMVLDMGSGGSIYPAMLKSNRKVFRTGALEDLAKIDSTFACVMENPTIQQSLTSETLTAVVECPENSLWIENFASIVVT